MSFTENNSGGLVYMTADNISAPHMFTTRIGGVSRGVFEGLNLAERRGDEPENVVENYRRVAEMFKCGVNDFAFTRQVHGNTVIKVDSTFRHELFSPIEYEADGLITDVIGLPLIVFTADCIPILLYDPIRKAVGAVHAGWRGTVADITGVAVRTMATEFGCHPADIRAAVGAGISACCFETDGDVPAALELNLGCEAKELVVLSELEHSKYYVDLKRANMRFLIKAGVLEKNISILSECTACNNSRYWSHRKTGEARGSQAAIIMLT